MERTPETGDPYEGFETPSTLFISCRDRAELASNIRYALRCRHTDIEAASQLADLPLPAARRLMESGEGAVGSAKRLLDALSCRTVYLPPVDKRGNFR